MIRIVDDIEEKQRIARSILTALPEWFGIPESTENYIRESANEIMVASFEEEKANGFLCLKETGKDTVELAVMGVLKTHHRKGIGRDMFDEAKRIAAEHMHRRPFAQRDGADHLGVCLSGRARGSILQLLPPA